MKSIFSLSFVLAIGCLATAVRADEGPQRGKNGDRRAEAIKRFDKDGDGKLNEQEREAARAAFQKSGRGGKGKGRAGGKGKGRPGGKGKGRPGGKGKGRPGGKGGGKGRPGGPDGQRPSAEEIMKRFDKNDDGKLVADEVPEQVWARMSAADENKDGAITKAELEARGGGGRDGRGPGGRGPGGGRPNPAEMFKHMDKNNDGKLSKDEVPERLWERLSKADKNSDNAITKAELEAAMAQMRGQRPGGGRPNPAEMFKRMDKNNDGKLSKDEVPEQFWARLSRADANHDDVLTKAELEKAFQNRGGPGGDKAGKKGGKKGGRPRTGKRGDAASKPEKKDN